MSLEVFRYLSDSGGNFTENLPTSQRPPVPGEENDNSSNEGKGSQCSRSGDSSVRCTNEKSPAATPRRSNLYPNHHTLDPNKRLSMTDDEAPLGFEPEGSASVTPPYTRWTESLHALLGDDDGIRLFKQFLNQEKAEDPLLFWLATEGFKKKPAEDPKRTELAKVIYRRFVKTGGQQAVKISPANRTLIEESVRKGSFDHTLFDAAQGEVEESIRETTYPLFLKSDLYVQYINNGGVSPKSSESSSSSGNNSRVPGLLPTLPEDAELIDIPKDELTDLSKSVPLTSEMLLATSCYRSGYSSRDKAGRFLQGSSRKLMSPYHASYAAYAPAASANDSELQSLSSDAISDDTMSLTDSSVDGGPIIRHSRQQRRRQQRAMKTNIRQNGKVASFPPFPHMQRPQKEVQPVAPNEFARILTEKLERVVQEREAQERLVARLKEVEGSECEADISSSTVTTEGAPVISNFKSNGGDGGNMVEDDPNSILDEHCSRVFMDGQSPGNFSPRRPKSPPERARRAKSAGSIPGMPQMPPGYTKQMLQKHRSRSKDALVRGDSGPQDYIDADIPVQHKYHHHYYSQKSKHQIEMDATRRTMAVYVQDGTEQSYDKYSANSDTGTSSYPYDAVYVDTGKYKKKSSSSKKSDTSSISKTTDSGIYEGPPSLPSDSEKNTSIEQWLRQGEQYSLPSKKSASSRGREQQHKRSAHRLPNDMPMSSSMSPHRPTHATSKRATLAYNTSRPGSVERPYTPTNPLHVHTKRSVPSQPIMQDPCMPLNPPPDSMTLLEEVRRRIESSSKQQKLRHQEASRSKERRSSNSSNQGTMRTSSSNGSTQGSLRVTSAPVKISAVSPDNPEMPLPGSSSSNSGKKTSSSSSSKNRHSTPATSTNADQKTTVTVAYYFCNDPIPYRTTLPGEHVTLAQFKTLITKRGNYRYTFKTPSDEFDTGVVHEIISDESAILPIFHGKIIGKVEKID